MSCKAVLLAACTVLSARAFAQDALDLSKDPRLQQKVDFHVKRILLPALITAFHNQTHQRFLLSNDLDERMVCVFANQQPLGLVMRDVAQVVCGEWEDLGTGWRLNLPKKVQATLASYTSQEAAMLRQEVADRANALARIASTQKWSGVSPDAHLAPEEPELRETPEQWAKRVVRDPAYYIAGIMFSRVRMIGEGGGKLDCTGDFLFDNAPVAYRLVAPPNPQVAQLNQCGPAGDLGAGLEGRQIAVRNLPWAGSFQSVLVDKSAHKPERPRHLIRFPKPVDGLAETKQGKWLLDWETPLDDCKDAVLDTPSKQVMLGKSPYYSGQHGIEDYLEALADASGVPIVCDGFRVPLIGKMPVSGGETVRQQLQGLIKSQSCFVRIENGSVMVRHGGFWDLQAWEPPEDLLSMLESTRRPGLDDYADFAFAYMSEARVGGLVYFYPFFETKEIPLMRCDPTPLRDSLFTLAAFGQLTDEQRICVLSGGAIDWYRDEMDSTHVQTDFFNSKDTKGKPVTFWTQHVAGKTAGQDAYINASAMFGPLYGGTPTGFEFQLLESFAEPSAYRHLWGDSPDDRLDFVSHYEEVALFHAHFFRLYGPSSGVTSFAPRAERNLIGSFLFFSSVSDNDGVMNQVQIPASTVR